MKYISNNEADGAFERLLRAEIGRATKAGAPCGQFDCDFSAAYIERNLTCGEVARYEVHLAACPNCRIQVARLARSGYEAALNPPAQEVSSLFQETVPFDARLANRKSGSVLSRIFGNFLRPQWIAAATAALVLLVAVPIFIILKNAQRANRPSASFVDKSRVATPSPAAAPEQDSRSVDQKGVLSYYSGAPNLSQPGGGAESSRSAASPPASNPAAEAGKTATGFADGDLNRQVSPAAASPSEAATQKSEEKHQQVEADRLSAANQIAQNRSQQNERNEQQNSQEGAKIAAAGAASQVEGRQQAREQAPAAPSVVSATQYDKESPTKGGERAAGSEQISTKDAQTLPDDSNKKVSILRPGGVSPDSARAKEGRNTIRPKDSEPPRTESSHDEAERRIAKGPARDFAVRNRTDADSVRKPAPPPLAKTQKLERRVENKRFRLQAGIWTDKAFKPDREIPAVTLIRDSDLYRSALEKQPGLRAFLAGFGPDERVIVVYKKIIYTVLPSK